MKDLYDSSGFQWCDLDKKDELFEHGGAARFLVARHRTGEKKPVGFVHFRFTLQGEAVGVIGGEPCLYVMDAQLEPAVQRKGLGTHMFSMLDTIARKQGMNHLMLPFVKGDLKTLGLELAKFSDLASRLQDVLDATLEITKRTRGEYTNVYFNKRIQIAGDAASQPSADEVPF